jgi:hypothetical protein
MRRLRVSLLVAWVLGALALLSEPVVAGWLSFGMGWGSKWDDPVHPNPATVTWGFVPDGTAMDPAFPLAPEATGTSQLGALRSAYDASYGAGAFDAALERAFDTWSAVAGIDFVGPVADPGLPLGSSGATSPDLRVSAFAPVPASGFEFVGAVGYGPPGDDLHFPDPVAGDIVFNLASLFIQPAGDEGDPIVGFGNDLENLFLHELGHAAIGLGHPAEGPGEVMYVGAGCCDAINREPSPDDIDGAQSVYGLSDTPACDNGIDDDGDGLYDADDPGCFDADSLLEDPQCDDGLDNDLDGRTDWDGGPGGGTADPQCNQPYKNKEKSGCGLGFELALLLPLLRGTRRVTRARSVRPSASAAAVPGSGTG